MVMRSAAIDLAPRGITCMFAQPFEHQFGQPAPSKPMAHDAAPSSRLSLRPVPCRQRAVSCQPPRTPSTTGTVRRCSLCRTGLQAPGIAGNARPHVSHFQGRHARKIIDDFSDTADFGRELTLSILLTYFGQKRAYKVHALVRILFVPILQQRLGQRSH